MNREVWTGHTTPMANRGARAGGSTGAVLAKKINEEEDFPLSAADYVEQYGDHPIRIDYETVVSVEEIFGASRKRNSGTSSSSTRNSARDARERLLVLRGC